MSVQRRERPIIFGADSIRAIQDGRKTQTRRAVRWAIKSQSDGVKQRLFTAYDADEINRLLSTRCATHPCQRVTCPYGVSGDRLWVRENYMVRPTPGCSVDESMLGTKVSVFYRGGNQRDLSGGCVEFGGALVSFGAVDYSPDRYGIWRSPIHMPRWASRLTLELTQVRVERLWEMSQRDVRAEGVGGGFERFPIIWDELNGKREGCSWDDDPWVWVLVFRLAQA